MKVIVEANLFEPGAAWTSDLVRLLSFALRERHFIEVEPIEDPRFSDWLAEQSSPLREECTLALDLGTELSASRGWAKSIRVGAGPSNWTQEVPRLGIADALRLLDKPLKVFLENGRTDRTFLLVIGGPERASALEALEMQGAVEMANGGGLQELGRILKDMSVPERFRSFAVFDSDALMPGRPSKTSRDLAKDCSRWQVSFHQLRRRTAENYLPVASIEQWAANDSEHKKRARALGRLKPIQRYHFNLRTGFLGDQEREERPHELEDFLSDIAKTDRSILEKGFGRKIREAFAMYSNPAWFHQDDSEREGETICDLILNHC